MMDFLKRTFRPIAAVSSCSAALLLSASCDNNVAQPKKEKDTSYFKVAPVPVPEAHRNRLGEEPSDFLRSRASDPIHWQPWSPAVLDQAKSEQKLIFAVIGNGRFPECAVLLDSLRKKPGMISKLHENYICCLVDVDVYPEVGIRVAMLSSEIQRRVAFPAIMWASHEGNPVAWLPLSSNDVDDIDEVFGNSDAMVSRIWRDSPLYVIQNSRRDNDSRQQRQTPLMVDAIQPGALKTTVHDGLRRLSSLYDPGTGNVDGGGGLVPSSLWRLAGTAALCPSTDPTVSGRLKVMLEGNSDLLLRSAIRDPLDRGFFSARRSNGWDLPVFMKTADAQSQMASGLARASVLLDSPRHLEAAREVLDFAGRHFGAEGAGLGSYEAAPPKSMESLIYLWSQEALREFLTPQEFAVASAAYGISGMGNIPPESDPKRDFFRKNTLGAKRSATEVAEQLQMDVAEVAPLLEAVRKRLLTQREEVLGRGNALFLESARFTATNARFVTVLAEVAAISNDAALLKQAKEILDYIETKHRNSNGELLRVPQTGNRRDVAARGEDYAALMEAHFSMYRLDLDPRHLETVLDLAGKLLSGHLTADGFIAEPPTSDRVGVLHTYNNRMIFGDSTWGTVFGPLTRIRQLTGDADVTAATDSLLRVMLKQLGGAASANDLIHSDFLNNARIALADTVVVLEGNPGSPEFDALHQVLRRPEYWAVTVVRVADGLPEAVNRPAAAAGAPVAHVSAGQAAARSAADPAELERLLQEALRRD